MLKSQRATATVQVQVTAAVNQKENTAAMEKLMWEEEEEKDKMGRLA